MDKLINTKSGIKNEMLFISFKIEMDNIKKSIENIQNSLDAIQSKIQEIQGSDK